MERSETSTMEEKYQVEPPNRKKKKKVWVTNHEVLMTHLLTLDEDSIASS
jgi:hypothetical protein